MKPWFPILVPPLAALVQQSASYALVAYECAQQQRLPVHAIAAVALVVTIVGIVSAWRDLHAVRAVPPQETGDHRSNARFLAIVGIFVSAIAALAVIAMWLPAAFLPPCVR